MAFKPPLGQSGLSNPTNPTSPNNPNNFVSPPNGFYDTSRTSSPGIPAELTNKSAASLIPYDIEYAFRNQSLKNIDGSLRFSLSIPFGSSTYFFQGHIDPNHLTDEQNKRFVKLDTLNGVILQDFGFMPETIELRGTTGSAYYREIGQLDSIYNAQ